MLITPNRSNTESRTHEPTGVTVTFRRIGYIERCRLLADASALGNLGHIIPALAQKGVGVMKWEGVTRAGGTNGELTTHVPYSPEALDAVVDADPTFGAWFSDQLWEMSGLPALDKGDNATQSIEEDDEAGKSDAPVTG